MSSALELGRGGRRHIWTRGDRLRAAREDMPGRPSQAGFAQLVGFSKNTVARYERDEKGADKAVVILRWAQVSGYDADWLWSGDGPSDGDTGPITLGYPDSSARFAA